MYDARRLVRVVIESRWGVREGSARRMFEIFPRPIRGSRWEIFIDSYPSIAAHIWLQVNIISLGVGCSRVLYIFMGTYTHMCRFCCD